MSGYYMAGAGRVDITPPLYVPSLGFRPRHLPFQGVHDPLFARAVVISDGKETIAVIALDGIGIANSVMGAKGSFTDIVRDNIQTATGIRKSRIMLASTHAHSTPETIGFRPLHQVPGATEWLHALIGQIVACVEHACRDMNRAVLKTVRGRVEGISYNRRLTDSLDTEMIALMLESPEGKGDILLVSYACHPVIVQAQPLVSADFVGGMIEGVRSALPTVKECLFLQGACADINPICNDTGHFSDVFWMGRALSGEAVKLYSLMLVPGYPEGPVGIRAVSKHAELPSRPLPDTQEVKRIERDVARLSAQLANGENPDRSKASAELSAKEEMLQRIREGDDSFEAEIQAFRIGNAALIGVPCEPFCETGLALKREMSPLLGIPVGYANGYLGYIAPPDEWEKGGYEVKLGPWSKTGVEGYGLLLKELAAVSGVIKEARIAY